MNRIEANKISAKVVDLLEKERVAHGISKLQISKQTGLSRTAITLMVQKKNSPTLRTLIMVSSAIGVDIKELIAKAEEE